MTSESLLQYYQERNLNPVPIALDDEKKWQEHVAKRQNLYQRHLGIPLSLLEGKSVLEFGCNSGENALVLASMGAKLTLVEPNDQVLPRLKEQFAKFNLEGAIVDLVQEKVGDFTTDKLFDVVIAEGFIFSLPGRDELLAKLAGHAKPNGVVVTSFNDRYGSLIELTKRMLLWHVCQLENVDRIDSEKSLELAQKLFLEDFQKINVSRPFEIWWEEMVVNPIFSFPYLWSVDEILPIVENAGCEFYSSSPSWSSVDQFDWYKNVPNREERHQRIIEEQRNMLPYFITGLGPLSEERIPVSQSTLKSVYSLGKNISDYTQDLNQSTETVRYPELLDQYFNQCKDQRLQEFNAELKRLFEVFQSGTTEQLINAYLETKYLRNLWGVPCHYMSYIKGSNG